MAFLLDYSYIRAVLAGTSPQKVVGYTPPPLPSLGLLNQYNEEVKQPCRYMFLRLIISLLEKPNACAGFVKPYHPCHKNYYLVLQDIMDFFKAKLTGTSKRFPGYLQVSDIETRIAQIRVKEEAFFVLHTKASQYRNALWENFLLGFCYDHEMLTSDLKNYQEAEKKAEKINSAEEYCKNQLPEQNNQPDESGKISAEDSVKLFAGVLGYLHRQLARPELRAKPKQLAILNAKLEAVRTAMSQSYANNDPTQALKNLAKSDIINKRRHYFDPRHTQTRQLIEKMLSNDKPAKCKRSRRHTR